MGSKAGLKLGGSAWGGDVHTGRSGIDVKSLEGTLAIVTGAARGIGRARAKRLAADGAQVLLADIQDEAGKQVAWRIEDEQHGRTDYFHCDVSDVDGGDAMVEHALEVFGGIDVPVTNAGIEGEQARTHNQSEDNWDRVVPPIPAHEV